MSTITAVKARAQFSDVMSRTAYRKERIVVTKNGKGVAAVVPMEDLKLLEELEDRRDYKEAVKALKKGGKPVPFEEYLRKRGR